MWVVDRGTANTKQVTKNMALLHLQSSYITDKPNSYLYKSLSYIPIKPKLTIISQDSLSSSPSPSEPTIEKPPSSKKSISSSGQGFGPGSGPAQVANLGAAKKKQKGRRERGPIIRRTPIEKPAFLDKKGGDEVKEQSLNENAFLLTWLGLGALILIEGIALAASGFLPEEWDKFFVKFLYPSFTPTVFLFVAGTVVYGVFKYLQNESVRNQK